MRKYLGQLLDCGTWLGSDSTPNTCDEMYVTRY